ncbi:MAG: chromosome segregation protein SMC [Planctomycetes bacterium]|nr:chromosome segregation protein SMC [Planctomycetota bacterium]
MKLKKLVVAGFKSFADRTEFDFDDGISCIVGPNGCGKSNVVDAFKWVLGEQSAKSLRGSEMMDVIFNGSSSRRASGLAEVSLVFDNSSGALQLASLGEEAAGGLITVTRRLYRSGQSEYLINKTPSRLRDIREMFMDTGVGIDAYSVIEQGRVESFLQASQDDRRAIFDEAAGISKYKARKKEAIRKLERVEQNLLRVTDVLGEVQKRLRSIKYQAGKARSYQEYSEQLKELRLLFFQAQYHTMQAQRVDLQTRLNTGADRLSSVSTGIDHLESARSAAEVEAVDLERSAREVQGKVAQISSQITARQERAQLLTSRLKELGEQIVQAAARCEELEAKAQTFETEFNARNAELAEIDAMSQELGVKVEALRGEHAARQSSITELCDNLEDEKAGTIDILRRMSQLHNEIHTCGIRRENLAGQRTRLTGRSAEIEKALEALLIEKSARQSKMSEIQAVLAESQARLEQTRQANKELIAGEQAAQRELSELREKRSSLKGRRDTLREMQSRREGVGEGVKKVLEAASKGALKGLRGMLGDFVQSDLEHSALVEAAMAGMDQYIVVDAYEDLTACAGEIQKILAGRGGLELLCLDRMAGGFIQDFDASTCEGVIARVMDWMKFEPVIAPTMWRLYGKTFVTADLESAARASDRAPRGSRFVTLGGEVLESDGRVRLGAGKKASGVITRRSEISELEDKLRGLDEQIEQLQQRCSTMHGEREHLENLQQKLRTAVYEASTERVECEGGLGRANDQIARLQREQPVVMQDLKNLADQIEQTLVNEDQAKQKAQELERLYNERQGEVRRLEEAIAAARAGIEQLSASLTEAKVAQAQCQQKRLSLKETINSLTRQREAMLRDVEAGRNQIALNRTRCDEAKAAIETANAEVEQLYSEKQALDTESADIEESRKGLSDKLDEIRKALTAKRSEHDEASKAHNALRIELGEADVRIENLIARAADEMQIDLVERHAGYQHDEQRDWAAVEEEIKDLKGKIERLGNVNLEAIAEQEELVKREEFLSTQLQDVQASQRQLDDLIKRINKESRELFLQTFEAVRANFQELFRKLFGGGRADMFLLNEDDVLESGIEIVARPPGKELRSISLLSGGEKTMTALALLFSIFRSKPSPFCLLDEVDAALDEANNERFNNLVGEFVGTSQFLVISHSKRTMSMASVLYGVTMQEPGVSKRISVRFEDSGKKLDEQLTPIGA